MLQFGAAAAKVERAAPRRATVAKQVIAESEEESEAEEEGGSEADASGSDGGWD